MKIEQASVFPWRLILAGAVFVGGCGWAIVSIMQDPRASTLSTAPSSPHKPGALIAAAPPARPPMEAGEQEASAARTTESVNAALATIPIQSPSASDRAAIAKEVSESLLLAIDPTADRYMTYLVDRGDAENPFIKLQSGDREEFLRTRSQCFAGQQPELSKVQVRWRYIDGREIGKVTDRGQNGTPKRSLDATNNPESSGLTVMEVIVPVPAKTLTKGTKPCRLGFWIGKTRSNPTWSTMKIYAYDIPGNVPLLLPPI